MKTQKKLTKEIKFVDISPIHNKENQYDKVNYGPMSILPT